MDAAPSGIDELFSRRYGSALPAVALASGAGAIETLLSHRSVRKYDSRSAPNGTLELLLAAAQSAASSSNLQLWSVIAVDDPERRRRLSRVAGDQAHVRESALFLVWLADLNRATTLARSLGVEPEGLEYLEMFLMASVDAALAAQNAVVAAEAQGLGSVYIGALRNRPEEVAEILELPPRVFALFGLCVGYADGSVATAVKPRLPQSVVLSRNTYGAVSQDAVRRYDQVMTEFYSAQGMQVPAGGWSLHSARRVQSAAALNGRHRLLETLHNLGFPLR
ncbi:MAG TPA: NADPH-dependent oxidoreductase [Polyangiaceae bacterium]|nr:NADPH-dependent oxidoreductase [Polyangiaceae bacterium]